MSYNKKLNPHQNNYQQNVIRASSDSRVGINNKFRLEKKYGSLSNRIEFLNRIQLHSLFTRWWFAVFFLLGLVCLFLDFKGAFFNVLDLFIVMLDAYLIARNKIAGIYLAIIECFIYAFIAFRSQLYGEIVKVLLISAPLYVYALIKWNKAGIKKNNKSNEDVIIRKLTKKQVGFTFIAVILLSIVCYFFLKYALGQKSALIFGSLSLTFMIIGKILIANHYMDNYIIYIISGFVGLFMWIETIFASGFSIAILTMIIYRIALLFNDYHSYGLWKNMYRRIIVNNKGYLFVRRKLKIKKIIKLRRQYRNLTWNRDIDIAKNS